MAQGGPDVAKIASALRGAASTGVRNLNYKLEGNSVVITGEAETIAAKQQAFKAVTSAVGDMGVMNGITVGQAAPAAAPSSAAGGGFVPASMPATPAAGDATAILEAKAREHREKLDWKHSVVDLMKLLGADSSIDARRKLAGKLGYQGDMGDSAKMNMWLHGELMKRVAASGGNLPKDLLA
jgi:hypothetical protein